MKFNGFAAVPHKLVGHFLVLDGEIEYIGFDRGSAGVPVRAAEPGLDQFAFVGFPDIALVDELVELTCLHTVSDDDIEPEIDEKKFREVLERKDKKIKEKFNLMISYLSTFSQSFSFYKNSRVEIMKGAGSNANEEFTLLVNSIFQKCYIKITIRNIRIILKNW